MSRSCPPVLEARNITKRFGVITALANVSVDFLPGEVHSIVGENGAGKSTLVKILTGYHVEYEGELRLRGKHVKFRSTRHAQEEGIASVYQERHLVPELSVAENVFLGRLPRSRLGLVDWKYMCQKAQEQLNELGVHLDVMQKVGNCSLGFRQMVEIARILFWGGDVIVLDEPTGALSIAERDELFSLISRLRGQGKTIIYISHLLEEIIAISDRITVLRNGRKITTVRAGDVGLESLIQMVTGGIAHAPGLEPGDSREKPGSVGDEVILEGRALCVSGHLRDVSFRLYQGEALGLYGNVGSGMHALGEAIFGLRKFNSGLLLLEGEPVSFSSPAEAIRHGLAFVPEERQEALWLDQSVARNVTIGHLTRLSRFLVRGSHETSIASQVINRMNITPADPMAPVQRLSGGNRQKVVVGRWTVEAPKVLILYEPTNGMDIGAKRAMVQKVRDLKRQGLSLLIGSTDPEVILDCCDRALVFRRGRVVAELSPEILTKERLVFYG
ncbi:MAG: sugar ABC transporter ATP-binding protein [Anaerolineae bacterium]